jgi:hypothetical protein
MLHHENRAMTVNILTRLEYDGVPEGDNIRVAYTASGGPETLKAGRGAAGWESVF